MIKYLYPLLAAICFAPVAEAKVEKGFSATTASGNMSLVVDSIDFRSDLTRIYGKLKGRAHTSNRIDDMTLTNTATGKTSHLTDIDGVDLRRYFQWEDNGLIPVEIDFPAGHLSTFTISTSGPNGSSKWNITKIKSKKQRKVTKKTRRK